MSCNHLIFVILYIDCFYFLLDTIYELCLQMLRVLRQDDLLTSVAMDFKYRYEVIQGCFDVNKSDVVEIIKVR